MHFTSDLRLTSIFRRYYVHIDMLFASLSFSNAYKFRFVLYFVFEWNGMEWFKIRFPNIKSVIIKTDLNI